MVLLVSTVSLYLMPHKLYKRILCTLCIRYTAAFYTCASVVSRSESGFVLSTTDLTASFRHRHDLVTLESEAQKIPLTPKPLVKNT